MQGNRTVCEPLKYLIRMPDNQEVKCFEFTVFATPYELLGGAKKFRPPRIISVYALASLGYHSHPT